MNLNKAAIQPISFCTCFLLVNISGISSMALIWSGLTSMPLYDTRKLRNSPEVMPKAHFLGFSFMPYRLIISKASFRWSMWSSFLISYASFVLMI